MPRTVFTTAILLKPQKKQTESKENQKCTCLHSEKIKVMSSSANPIRSLKSTTGFLPQLLQKLHATSVGSAPEVYTLYVQPL